MRHISVLFSILLFTSCTWVKDDIDECPYGFWLNLHYTCNILDVEAVTECVKEVSVYVYDADGHYVTRLDVPQSALLANGHRVRVDGLPEGDYQFVVWSGLGNSQYTVSGDRLTMEEFRLSLAGASPGIATPLPDLYYGSLQTVHYDDAYATYDVFMMKDTNQLACLVVPMSEGGDISADDYQMRVVAANGTMDIRNQPFPGRTVSYEPFARQTVVVDDPEYGQLPAMSFSIMTLRLMADSDCRLVFEKKETGETLFNISLPEYIGMIGALYSNSGRQLTVQEYLDRQDFYTIVFFLSADMNQLLQLQVNSWRLRAHNHLKL